MLIQYITGPSTKNPYKKENVYVTILSVCVCVWEGHKNAHLI